MTNQQLFSLLYFSPTEENLQEIIESNPNIFGEHNWAPFGGNFSNFGVVENQQSNPIAALIEKLTNSIDAILLKKCLKTGIDPKSSTAPRSMEEAVQTFFAKEHKNWDLPSFRRTQAEDIQILADGPKFNTSLIIYDDGEGQHPENFENTFLSLLRGNKNEIHFVQGKYNMGGSGAVVFCGKRRFQLIGSKRFDNSGKFGFTLIREHPLTSAEQQIKKGTWYEYLKIDGEIPSFDGDAMDLGLYNRKFKTGTVIKLYSYSLPSGSRSVISKDLNQSINEYLFEPALPILTVDKKERYPDDRALERSLYGLKRRLEQDESKYIDEYFSEIFNNDLFGKGKVSCYVFKTRVDKKSVKESKETIRKEFFKNNMSVLFSVNGQVHGYYTTEFISRSLKLNLLKNHLLIHVDCTEMDYNFRKELFMASRDRLKDSEETKQLRDFLARKLGAATGRLAAIESKRKDSISVDSGDTAELLRSFTKTLPISSDLFKLLDQTFKLELKPEKPEKKERNQKSQKEESIPFKPQRYPSFFRLKVKNEEQKEIAKIPIGGERIIRFESDVENEYFDRIDDPGELKISLLDFKNNETSGGNGPGPIEKIEDVFNVNISSPNEGVIKISLGPKKEANVGDAVKIKASLGAPGDDFDEIFWVKVSAPEAPKENVKKEEKTEDLLGLPEFVLAYKEEKENSVTWEKVEEATSEEMNYSTVMFPLAKGDNLEKIYINMDSKVLKNFKSKYKNPSEIQLEIADRKFISSVYFHTLFLYSITKNRKYKIIQEKDGQDQDIELGSYLKDLFESYYSEFILNFGGANELLQGIAD